MAEFPSSPVTPAELFERWLPAAFAEAAVPDDVKTVDLELGIQLEGEGGGQWCFQLVEGSLQVEPRSREGAAFTLVQSVDDWRGALWEGRGGAIGKQAAAVFHPDRLAAAPGAGGLGAPTPAGLARFSSLDGLIRMVVTGAEGGDWSVAFKLGGGPIPAEATTTVTLAAEDAAAMERGEMSPLEAFMAGRVQVAGDVALLMQMQALQMQP